VSSDITEALLHREFVDFGGAFVCSAGFIVAMLLAAMRLLIALMCPLSALSGTLHVFLRDGLPGGEVFSLRSSSCARWAASLPGDSAMSRHYACGP